MSHVAWPRVQCKFEALHSTHSRHWATTEMKLITVALCICSLTFSAANTKNATILTLFFGGDVSYLNDRTTQAWRELNKAGNKTLTDMGLDASVIHASIRGGQLTEESLKSRMRSASDATLQVNYSICDALAEKITRNCSGTIADRTRGREVNDVLERQVKMCRSGYSALDGNSEETALLECLSTRSTCDVGARECLVRTSTLSKRDERTPQRRLMIWGLVEVGFGLLMVLLMIVFEYTTIPVLCAALLGIVGARDIWQALRMRIAAKNATMVSTPPVVNGMNFKRR